MKIQILDKTKKKTFIEGTSDVGIKKIPELLIRSGTEKIRAYTGDLSKDTIMSLWRILPIEGIGLYAGKEIIDKNGRRETRLTIDGQHLWENQLDKRILKLTESQEEQWFKRQDIELNEEQFDLGNGFVNVQSFSDNDFIGIGKIGNEGKTLFGFLPKERSRKTQLL